MHKVITCLRSCKGGAPHRSGMSALKENAAGKECQMLCGEGRRHRDLAAPGMRHAGECSALKDAPGGCPRGMPPRGTVDALHMHGQAAHGIAPRVMAMPRMHAAFAAGNPRQDLSAHKFSKHFLNVSSENFAAILTVFVFAEVDLPAFDSQLKARTVHAISALPGCLPGR